MRDKEHKIWKDIRAAWEEMTGQRTGNSTLPNRYEYVWRVRFVEVGLH